MSEEWLPWESAAEMYRDRDDDLICPVCNRLGPICRCDDPDFGNFDTPEDNQREREKGE